MDKSAFEQGRNDWRLNHSDALFRNGTVNLASTTLVVKKSTVVDGFNRRVFIKLISRGITDDPKRLLAESSMYILSIL